MSCEYCLLQSSSLILCKDCLIVLCSDCHKRLTVFKTHISSHFFYRVPDLCKIHDFLTDSEINSSQCLKLFQSIARFGSGNWEKLDASLGSDRSSKAVYYKLLEMHGTDVNFYLDEAPFLPIEFSTPLDSPASINAPSYLNLNRGDFEIEFDDAAELLIADLEFLPEDTPHETNLKTNILKYFNERLSERINMKKFVIEKMMPFWQMLKSNELSPIEIELAEKYLPLLRLSESLDEFMELVKIEAAERRLLLDESVSITEPGKISSQSIKTLLEKQEVLEKSFERFVESEKYEQIKQDQRKIAQQLINSLS
jgi:hypothetical protein